MSVQRNFGWTRGRSSRAERLQNIPGDRTDPIAQTRHRGGARPEHGRADGPRGTGEAAEVTRLRREPPCPPVRPDLPVPAHLSRLGRRVTRCSKVLNISSSARNQSVLGGALHRVRAVWPEGSSRPSHGGRRGRRAREVCTRTRSAGSALAPVARCGRCGWPVVVVRGPERLSVGVASAAGADGVAEISQTSAYYREPQK